MGKVADTLTARVLSAEPFDFGLKLGVIVKFADGSQRALMIPVERLLAANAS